MEVGGVMDVDVIMPVYNGATFIAEALRSAAEQSRPPARIIVVDDASRDRTAEVVRDFRHPRVPVEYLRLASNQGPSAARNRGIRASSSPYLAFLDADDIWSETKLERQLALFRQPRFARLGVVSCSHYLVDSHNQLLSPRALPRSVRPRGRILDPLLQDNLVSGGSAALVRRDCFATVGLWDESLRTSEDWDMWLRILCRHDFDHCAEPLLRIRVHAANASHHELRMFCGLVRVLNKWASYARTRPRVMHGWRLFAARMLAAGCRRLPDWRFLHTLEAQMSPELRNLFWRQALPLGLTIGQRASLKALAKLHLLPETAA